MKRDGARKGEEGRGKPSPGPIRVPGRPRRRLTHWGGGLTEQRKEGGEGPVVGIVGLPGWVCRTGGEEASGKSPGWREGLVWGLAQGGGPDKPRAHRATRPTVRGGIGWAGAPSRDAWVGQETAPGVSHRGGERDPQGGEVAEQLQKCGEREGTRAAAFRCLRPGQLQKQQGEEQQLPNSPTRGGRGGAWVPVEARGAVWTVVSRERRKQERERSGAQSSEHQLQHPVRGCRCVGGKRGSFFGASALPWRKRVPIGITSRYG